MRGPGPRDPAGAVGVSARCPAPPSSGAKTTVPCGTCRTCGDRCRRWDGNHKGATHV
ncbi:MAG: hypothetical protein AVDCRST_MAG07-3136 [uncultured Frankineae bacterium]|uniref:Uncharacterized protein n=1 Tax=uncultured Frankineae bacterium TaxID=437475 RepID=A0A6J4MAB6_9ACTN|nr:MAG: hypothetical protein AVDCRST_MAG07-3136 [uncultured Frankineae bacterium]